MLVSRTLFSDRKTPNAFTPYFVAGWSTQGWIWIPQLQRAATSWWTVLWTTKVVKKKLFYPYFSITSLVSDYFISISQVILLKLKQKNKILIQLICILLLFNTFFAS